MNMKKIILISQVPCSSGTYLTHWICENLNSNYWLISETSPFTFGQYSKKDVFFNSPGLSLYAQKYISFELYEKLYSNQIKDIILEWQQQTGVPYLVIRNWIFPEYFSFNSLNERSLLKKSFSYYDLLLNYHDDIVSVFTHRDPVDCWLGLHASFPQFARSMSLADYCERFLLLLNDWEMSTYDSNSISVKLEELSKSSKARVQFFKKLGVSSSEDKFMDKTVSRHDLSSGASGRKYDVLSTPQRRPISTIALDNLNKCTLLKKLRRKIGYNYDINANKMFCLLNCIPSALLTILYKCIPKRFAFHINRIYAKWRICTY